MTRPGRGRRRSAPMAAQSSWPARAPSTRSLARLGAMPPERDMFANFERMRREMDELFGDVFHRSGIAPRKRAGFSPAADVSYADDPPRAIVTAELAGIDADRLGLEIQGRELVLSGERRAIEREGRVYQQVEIEHGPF